MQSLSGEQVEYIMACVARRFAQEKRGIITSAAFYIADDVLMMGRRNGK